MKSFLIASATAAVLCFSYANVAAAADSPPASTPTPNAAKMALVQRIDKAMNFDSMMNQMMASIIPPMMEAMRKSHPDLTEQQAIDLAEITQRVSAKYFPRMKSVMYEAYVETFNEDELRSLAEFYETPNGQSILHKLPLVMQRFGPAMAGMMPDMQADMQTEICKKLSCPATPAKGK